MNLAAIRDQWRQPDEGGPVSDADTNTLRTKFDQLEPVHRSWIAGLKRQARQHGCDFHMNEVRSVRRYELHRGLILLAQAGADDDEDVRTLVASVMDSDVPHWPSIAAGHAVGALGAADAARFAQLADRYATGDVVGVVIGHGESAWLKVA
jgi:hypothetical protein